MNKKLTITIGAPVYNEGKNLPKLLQSIFEQKQDNYKIENIIIALDGCTDDSYKILKSLKYPFLTIINGPKNKGRVFRRNQIIAKSASDVLIFIDGDCVLENKESISKLVKPFIVNEKIALVGGNPVSVGIEGFVSKSLLIPQSIYTRTRYRINKGNNIFGCMCGMLAIRNYLYKSIVIPSDIMADDAYIYFKCLEKDYKFLNVKEAKVLHNLPADITTHIKRVRRHSKSSIDISKYFNKELIKNEFVIPKKILIQETLREFMNYPFQTLFIFAINRYAKLLNKYEK